MAEIGPLTIHKVRRLPFDHVGSLSIGPAAISYHNLKGLSVLGRGRLLAEHRFSDMASIEVSGDVAAQSRVGAIALFGWLGLGAKGTRDRVLVRIRMKDGSEPSYEVFNRRPGDIRSLLDPYARAAGVPWYEEQPQQMTEVGTGSSLADELTKLAALRDQGALSEEEFEAAKSRLLGP